MIAFLKFALALLVVLAAVTGAAIGVSGLQPIPVALEMFHLQDCQLPCWIGIIPGRTTIGQAYTLIRQTFPVPDFEHTVEYSPYDGRASWTATRNIDGRYLSVIFNRDTESAAVQTQDTIISQITIFYGPNDSLTLGDWAILLGKPQALSITWGNHWAAPNALYDRDGVRITLGAVTDNFDVSGWGIRAGTFDIYEDLGSAYHPNYRVPWRGWRVPYKDKLLALMLP